MSGTEKISKGWKTLFVKFNKLWFSSHLSVCRVCVWCDVMSRDHKKNLVSQLLKIFQQLLPLQDSLIPRIKNSAREIFREKTRIKKYLLKEWSRNFDLFCWRITWNWPTSLFLVFWFQNLIRQCTEYVQCRTRARTLFWKSEMLFPLNRLSPVQTVSFYIIETLLWLYKTCYFFPIPGFERYRTNVQFWIFGLFGL
jgi:hypothetical protein